MLRKLLFRRVEFPFNARLTMLYYRPIHHFSTTIKLNDTLAINDEQEIKSEIDVAFEQSSFDGIINLAEDSFNKQDFNITALSYHRLFNLYDEDPTNDYFSKMENQDLYNLYYRFVCTLHLLKDYDSAKYYIEDVIIPKFGQDFDVKLYGIYGLILKEGYNDIKSAEKYLKSKN